MTMVLAVGQQKVPLIIKIYFEEVKIGSPALHKKKYLLKNLGL
jgi:hypothetical protein